MIMRLFYFFLFTVIPLGCLSQEQDPYLKKLGVYDQSRRTLKDTILVRKLNKTGSDSSYTNPEKGELYAKEAIKIAAKIEDFKGQISGYIFLGSAKVYMNEYDSALFYVDRAFDISRKHHIDLLAVKSINMRGSIYAYKGDLVKASDQYFKALSLAEKIHEKHTITSYTNLGYVFFNLANYKKCTKYCEKGFQLAEKYKDTSAMLSTINLLALVQKNEEHPDLALTQFARGLELAQAANSIQLQAQMLYNMSNIYFDKKEYDKGFELFNQSIELSKTSGSFLSIAGSFHTLATNYSEIGRHKESEIASDSTMKYALKSGNYEMIKEAYEMKSIIMKLTNRFNKSLYYLEIAYKYKDSLNLADLNDAVSESEDSFEKKKKQMADSLKQVQADAKVDHDNKISAQQVKARENLIWVFAFVLVLVGIGLYYLKRKNQLVKNQNSIVKKQNAEIKIQHKEITDSILYAERIQDAIMSKEGEWQKISDAHFVLFKPKDVVSGDFYWAYNNADKNLSIWAVSDCTGHGVPGAFMSMLGTGFLNEIVIENRTTDPGTILDLLRSKIVTALTQKGEAKTKDGMDISICVWDKSANKLRYAGANNPLWIIRHKDSPPPDNVKKVLESKTSALSLLEIAPDKMPVGYQFATPPPFSTREIDVLNGDVYYLITDGFADQFGGEKGKKFKSLPLKYLILELQEKPVSDQRKVLDETFETWKGIEEQVDDVCIVGVKVIV
ncbi:MAG: serine phosphatase RsbU (regulator of sigma subunit)/tetratricopeptide (TPR) repeat protein [Crocinitomicaceae bacterium]|jgi:serine phosphatase RsbU (regulator of sigma subunit)/tetratricopeptide (TPR) repeat protein